MKILVVDDNARIRATIVSILSSPGVECVECDNGIKALTIYHEVSPAWVLMDIVMPEMDGIEATRRIVSTYPGARIVMVTAYDDPELRTAAKLAGATSYVLKEELTKLREVCVDVP